MKRKLWLVACGLCVSATLAAQSDVIAKLGSNAEEAHETIFSAFATGDITMAGSSKVFKTANDQARAAMVTAVVSFARAYTASPDFLKRWGVYRQEQKPSPPSAGPASMSDMQAQQIKALEEGIKNLEDTAKKMPQLKAAFDEQVKELRAQVETLKKPNPAENARVDALLTQGAQQAQADYKQSVAQWEKAYPTDPKPFIVKRLRDFLELSSTVEIGRAHV